MRSQVFAAQIRAAGQAEPRSKIHSATVAAAKPAVGEDRLEMHRLPGRPCLDVVGLQRQADVFPRGAETASDRR